MKSFGGFNSQVELDAQYNPSLGLADGADPLGYYQLRASEARKSLDCILDVPYGPTSAETLDIFPAQQARAPVFIFIHGGYWRSLSSKDFSGVAIGLNRLGITTVVINYALCPQVRLDEITRQARAAVSWVLRNVEDHRGDASRVGIGGHSAGAQLAAMCLQTDWDRGYGLPNDPLRAAVLVSGPYDLEPLRWSYLQPVLQLDDGIVQRNSPLSNLRKCATPTWITWGSEETPEFYRQSTQYHQAWLGAGNRALLSPQANADHFSAIHGFEYPDSPLCGWVADRLF